MTQLQSSYLGMSLKSPIVVGACPLTAEINSLQRLESAGAGAAVLPSLFEEQIQPLLSTGLGSAGESIGSQIVGPTEGEFSGYNLGPDGYLEKIRLAKRNVAMPIIASLNGSTLGGWVRFAELIEGAGTDALELNLCFITTDPDQSSDDVERRHLEVVELLRSKLTIPIAVKIGPSFAALPHFVKRLAEAGADGIVMFNRFLDPQFNLDTFEVNPHIGLSNPGELRQVLRWIAIVREQTTVSLAATSGIHDHGGVIRSILAGADVAMVASSLIKHGHDFLSEMLAGLRDFMAQHNFSNIDEFRGMMSRGNVMHPEAFERANYTKALASFAKNRPIQ